MGIFQTGYESLNSLGEKRKAEIAAQREAFIQQLRDAGREKEISKLLKKWKPSAATSEVTVPYEVAWCEGALFDDYIHDMHIMQQYAMLNRRIITETILKACKLHAEDQFETIHNYIDTGQT